MANNDDGDTMALPRIPEPLSFDGRQVRKPVHRRTIDPTASINRSFETRLYRTRRPRSWFTRPNSHFVIDMLTPADCYDAPVSSIAMKFIRASVLQPPRPVNVVKWSPDGRRLISGSTKGTFSYWFGTTFNFESTLQAHEDPVRALQWSHNGTWLISADGGGEIKYWEYNFNNLTVFRGHNTTVRGLSFAPTDLKFASCSDDQKIKIWDFHQSREERVITGHTNMVRCVDWHPYKGLIASGSADNKVKLWDPRAPDVLNTLHGSKNDVTNLQWNRNGHWLCVTSRDTIVKLYDMRTMKEMQSFRGHKKGVTTVSWHPCQERLFATGGYDGSLIYWLVGQQTPVAATRTDSMGEMWSMDWHPVGHLLATGSSDNATRFWSRHRPDSAMVGGSGADKEDELAAVGEFSQGAPGLAPGLGDLRKGTRPPPAMPSGAPPGLGGIPGLGSAGAPPGLSVPSPPPPSRPGYDGPPSYHSRPPLPPPNGHARPPMHGGGRPYGRGGGYGRPPPPGPPPPPGARHGHGNHPYAPSRGGRRPYRPMRGHR